ncbi:MAG: DUF721 domain-containing protein [Alphaproteobacteria bacterium]
MGRKPPKQAVPLAVLARRIIRPVAARRGFATADLLAAWPDIIGPQFAPVTQPERIAWPMQDPNEPGVLVLRVDGPAAVLIQHESDQIIERVNVFMGYRAVGRIRFVQGLVTSKARQPSAEAAPDKATDARLDRALDGLDKDDGLARALRRLGRGVLS